jgi:anti-sigma-K factor RskA
VQALAVACIALVAIGAWLSIELSRKQRTLQHVTGERDHLRFALEIMARSETRQVQFGQSDNVAHGRVFVTPKGTFVLIGSDLPSIASDRTFELWLIPKGAAPVPAGLFKANSGGTAVHVYQEPVNLSQISAVAVTVEPGQGSLAPTTKPFLVVPLA